MPAAHPGVGRLEVDATSGERVYAFVPHPLPPEPPPTFDPRDRELVDEASRALGRLDGIGRLRPATDLFACFCGRKEAVLSTALSQWC